MRSWKKSIRVSILPYSVFGLFFLGFLTGIVIPCFLWNRERMLAESSALYLLAELGKGSLSGADFFREVLLERGPFWILWVLSGLSIFGVPVSIAVLLWNGWYCGALLTLCILHFGLSGGFLGLLLLFPQYALYLTAFLEQSRQIFQISPCLSKTALPDEQNLKNYFLSSFFFTIFMLAGMLLEGFLHPLLLSAFLQKLSFF